LRPIGNLGLKAGTKADEDRRKAVMRVELICQFGAGDGGQVVRRGVTMGGIIRFLLGGAFGAALGFLISRRTAQKVRQGTLPAGPRMEPQAALRAAAPVAQPDVVAAEPPAVPPAVTAAAPSAAGVPEPPLAVAPSPPAEPVARPEYVTVTFSSKPPLEIAEPPVVAAPGPPVAPPAVVGAEPPTTAVPTPPLVAVPVVPAAPAEPVARPEYVTVTFPSRPPLEIVESPAAELPVAEAPPVVTEPPVALVPLIAPALSVAVAPEVVEEAPVDEVVDVVMTPGLLEEPLPGAGWEPSAIFAEEEQMFDEILPVVPEETRSYLPPELERREIVSEPAWSIVPLPAPFTETPAPSSEPEVPAAAETPVEAVAPLPVALADSLAEVPAEPVDRAAAVDDLKARIEETRRRIRRELEQPFLHADHAEVADSAEAPPILEPVVGDALTVEPDLTALTVEPDLASLTMESDLAALTGEPDLPAMTAPVELAAASTEVETTAEAAAQTAADYEAMRARIEMTRNRLKAKAFDAMMSGETALLGREPADASLKLPPSVDIDSEMDQSIELTLREEKD